VTLPGSTGGLSAPQNFTVTAVSSTVAQLAWSASTGATGYTVYYWNGSQAVNLGSVSSRTTSVNVTGLKAGSTDKFYITAYNATTSASTGWVTVVMPGGAVAVTAPQNFTATATSSTTGTLSWTASPGATGYIIYYWDGYQAVAIDTVGASTTSVNIGGMSASSTYQFAIVAYNATSSAATAWVSLTTPSAATTAAAQRVAQETAVAMMFSEVTKRWTTT
jgi:hypothetical protein